MVGTVCLSSAGLEKDPIDQVQVLTSMGDSSPVSFRLVHHGSCCHLRVQNTEFSTLLCGLSAGLEVQKFKNEKSDVVFCGAREIDSVAPWMFFPGFGVSKLGLDSSCYLLQG
jgi:hypothetical protein